MEQKESRLEGLPASETEAVKVKIDTVDKMEEALRKVIKKAANKYIGKKKVTSDSKPWLTPEIRAEITKRNALRKTISSNRKEWVEACQKVSEMVKEEKAKRWKDYVEQLDMKTNPKMVRQTIRGMDGRYQQRKENQSTDRRSG